MVFEMTGLLSPKSSEKKKIIGHFLVHDDSCCVSRRWDFSSGVVAALFFSKICSLVGRGLKPPRFEEPRKKNGAPLYRSSYVSWGCDTTIR